MCFQDRKISFLLRSMDRAWRALATHQHPRAGLTEAEEEAWVLEHEALALRFRAACRRYKDVIEKIELSRIEQEALVHALEDDAAEN